MAYLPSLADLCVFEHDGNEERAARSMVSAGTFVGQNLAQASTSSYNPRREYVKLVGLWYDEVEKTIQCHKMMRVNRIQTCFGTKTDFLLIYIAYYKLQTVQHYVRSRTCCPKTLTPGPPPVRRASPAT